ncbi:MAG TPA: tetratricopeptide repeat protein [Bryobacteraceae bacterium]|nr:tetratricopeptide repeat protein [Bryobacteraceae bacterium]
MNGRTHTAFFIFGLACLAAIPAYSQAPAGTASPAAGATAESPSTEAKAQAYYDYGMAHLYAEEAARFGGRQEYVNKAVDFYNKAIALDPTNSVVGEELAEFYLRSGNAEKAVDLANKLIQQNPNDAGAHKILARMYAAQLDPEQGKVDETALKNAIEHYQKAADIDPKDAESLSSLAHLYRVARNDAAAEKAFKAVLALDSSDDDALVGLAELYAGRGDFDSAIALLEPVSGEDADNNTLQILAELYEDSRNFGKAADTWKRLLPVAAGLQVRKHYCENLVHAGRVDEAITAWTELAAAEPKNVEDLVELSELYGAKRNYAKAHEMLDKAKAIENSIGVRMAEAELMDSEGKPADGITAVEGILVETQKPVYSDAQRAERISMLTSLAAMQRDSGRTADAVSSYRQIADLDPQTATVWEGKIIETLAEAKDFKGARAAADAALKKYSGDKDIQAEHASLLATLGEYDKALAELRALPNSDKDVQVLINIADVQEKAKRYKDALATLDSASLLATDQQQKQNIVFMRGALYEHQKDYDQAENAFRSVLKTDPDNAGALNYLGYMLADRNVRLDEAQQLISKAVDLEPDNGAYLDSLGWVHYRQNRLDQAADELRHALDRIGKDPTVHDHLAEVYFKQGKFREAAQEWELSVSEMKTASPSDADPAELKRISQRLEEAKAKAPKK